jgi:hypothetical protein
MGRWTLILISLAAVGVGWLILMPSRGGLAFFSPGTLELTTQSEFTILSGAFPVYRSFLEPVDNELVLFIQEQGFVAKTQNPPRRSIEVFHWNWAWKDGYGSLYDVLYRHRVAVREWCLADTERAKLYWSEAFKYLRSADANEVEAGEAILAHGWRTQSVDELKGEIENIKRDLGVK